MSQAAQKQREDRKVVFRRINGRVIPIAVSSGGTAAALDAARTHRVYVNKKAGITIDRKKFTVQPFAWEKIGDKITLKKHGKVAGTASFYRNDGAEFAFSWLGVNRANRGQGISKHLVKQAAVEAKSQGARTFFNHVVHPNSASVFGKGKGARNYYWMEHVSKGEISFSKVAKSKALPKVKVWHKKGAARNAIFRQTFIPKDLKRTVKPFRTLGNKIQIGLGITAAVAGLVALYRARKKDAKR